MSKLYTTHIKFHKDDIGICRRATVTTHFARREMLSPYVEACRNHKHTVDIYESEDCVITEVLLR